MESNCARSQQGIENRVDANQLIDRAGSAKYVLQDGIIDEKDVSEAQTASMITLQTTGILRRSSRPSDRAIKNIISAPTMIGLPKMLRARSKAL